MITLSVSSHNFSDAIFSPSESFHARVQGLVPGLGGLKETKNVKMFETKNVSSPSTCESQYCGEPP